jgi:hypothetical protein
LPLPATLSVAQAVHYALFRFVDLEHRRKHQFFPFPRPRNNHRRYSDPIYIRPISCTKEAIFTP